MKIKIKITRISEVVSIKPTIDLKPIYQRGSVWSDRKRKLLIDSILRGIDIPKIYFRKIDDMMSTYEIADGQQRMRAIFDFIDGVYALDKCIIGDKDYTGKSYNDLDQQTKAAFDSYKLTISFIKDATSQEVRTLFERLQMGEKLIPSELRNALASNVSYAINMLATTNLFFKTCKISKNRFKHQDYIAHAIALIHFNNKADLKAALLLRLYQELSESYPLDHFENSAKVLEAMEEINQAAKYRIVNKWAFVDIFYFLYNNISKIDSIDKTCFATTFLKFEGDRLKHGKKPEDLIEGNSVTPENKALYTYIQAFKSSGGNPKSIQARQEVFNSIFANCLK